MQPTAAQVVPQEPSLTSKKSSVFFRTSRMAESPAVPAPMMMTSTCSLIC